MKNFYKISVIFLCLFFVLSSNFEKVYANSSQPPSYIFVIEKSDDNIVVKLNEVECDSIRSDKHYNYYAFYKYDLKLDETNYINIESNGNNYSFEIPKVDSYENIYTVDIEKGTVEVGNSNFYVYARNFVRLIITLILEGLVFYMLGFRKKRSWIVFFIVNILTQLLLSSMLFGITPFDGYVIYLLILAEILIFISEMIAFGLLVKEKKWFVRVFYALLANTVSLTLGSYILMLLV